MEPRGGPTREACRDLSGKERSVERDVELGLE